MEARLDELDKFMRRGVREPQGWEAASVFLDTFVPLALVKTFSTSSMIPILILIQTRQSREVQAIVSILLAPA